MQIFIFYFYFFCDRVHQGFERLFEYTLKILYIYIYINIHILLCVYQHTNKKYSGIYFER